MTRPAQAWPAALDTESRSPKAQSGIPTINLPVLTSGCLLDPRLGYFSVPQFPHL